MSTPRDAIWRRLPCAPRRRWSGRPLALAVGVLCAIGAIAVPAARQAAPPVSTVQQPAGHQAMVERLAQLAEEARDAHLFSGEGQARRARAELAALPAATPDNLRWVMLMRVAEEELRLGNEEDAIARYQEARDLLVRTRLPVDPDWLPANLYRLGIAFLRWGETQNCAINPSAASCILPLRGDAIHQLPDGSRQAISAFSEVLARTDPDSMIHLRARWLLNVAYMTIGGYPEHVPARYLIPPSAFEPEAQLPRFENIAPALGLDLFDMAGSVIADDFDNDGYLDLVVSTWGPEGQLRFFRNNQDGTFVDRTGQAGLTGLYGGLNLMQADYDNDGHLDILVLRGAWLGAQGRHPNSLLRNNGNGTFTDVTFEAGLGGVHYPTQTAAWADFDGNGYLDLYIGNESSDALRAPGQLFRNNGDGTFTDVAAAAGVENFRFAKGVVWGDFDDDGRPDLYVSNLGAPNRLFRNNGDGTFTDVAGPLGVAGPEASFAAWFWDVDNDGVLDLFVSAYDADIADLAARALGLPSTAETARLYRGLGAGRFEDVSERYGIARPSAPMGVNVGDLDGDGYLDFYLGTGYPDYQNLMPNVMFLNRQGAGFADVSTAGGFAHLQKGHGIAFADFDNDGDLDVYEQMGGAFPGDRARNVLYENPGFGNRWLAVKLTGVRSNRSAIGARIRAEFVDTGTRRAIYRHVGSGGSFGANPLRQTLGLGQATIVDVLEIHWPATGLTQTFRDVPINRTIEVIEAESSYRPIALKVLQLKGHGGTGDVHVH